VIKQTDLGYSIPVAALRRVRAAASRSAGEELREKRAARRR